MKNIEIKVDRNTSYVDLPNNILGINGENLQGDIIMSFKNGFVDGIAWLEIEMPDKTKGYIMMDKVGEKYTLKIKSSLLTQVGLIHMNLRITEDENIDGIPVFKSNIFYLKVVESINATETIPDEYETWMDILNTKIVEVDNLNIELEKEDKKSTITITNKDGSVESVEVLDGQDGDDYILTQEDKNEIVDTVKPLVEESIQPTLDNNLKSAKDYTDNAIIKDFKDISYNQDTATFVFTRHDNTTFTVDLPIEQTVKNGYYDETTKELVLVLVSDQEIRIPATGLIDDYTGVDSATIQLTISADNKITANIKGGSITKTLLTTELQEEIDNKVNKSAFVYDEATETLTITI